ncbi:uncharacterized protein LOC142331727 [Lycorma delicatula]|uniref:uncharacterized protein LOC142331727 n=1 Tax=Lycorma delicatula TaxID=130591 RepID=UPI003F50E537
MSTQIHLDLIMLMYLIETVVNVKAQYYLLQNISSPVASAPITDETNPFVYNYKLSGQDVQQNHPATQNKLNKPIRNDQNQQRLQSSLPPGFFGLGATISSRLDNSKSTQINFLPKSSFHKRDTDNWIFVPAFPTEKPEINFSVVALAPPPPTIPSSGFVPPDGALLAPPPPNFNGNPLPSPRQFGR